MAIDDAVKRVRSYDPLIEKYAGKYNVPSNLIRAAILQESGGNPQAVSEQGAKGLMQIMPETFERLGGPGVHLTQRQVLTEALSIMPCTLKSLEHQKQQ